MITGNKGITGLRGSTGLSGVTGAQGIFGSSGSFIAKTKAIFGDSLKVFIDPRVVSSTQTTDQIDDLSGNDNHGAITAGNGSYTTYNGQRVLHLESACITFADSADFDHSTEGLFTLGLFVNNSIASAYNAFMSKYSQSPGQREYALFHASATQGIELTNNPSGGSPSGLNRDIPMVNGEGKVMGIRAEAGASGLMEALWDGSVSKLAKNVTLFSGSEAFRVGGYGTNVAVDMYVGPFVYVKGRPTRAQIDAWASLVAADYGLTWAKESETLIVSFASQSNKTLPFTNSGAYAQGGLDGFNEQSPLSGYKYWEALNTSTSGFPLREANASPPTTFGYVQNDGSQGIAFTSYYLANLESAVNGKSQWGDPGKIRYPYAHDCEGDVGNSKAEIKGSMSDLIDLLVAEHGSDITAIVHVSPTYALSVTDADWQALKEARIEGVSEHANGLAAALQFETYHYARQDGQHFTDASNRLIFKDIVRLCTYLDGRGAAIVEPTVQSATWSGDEVTITLSESVTGTEFGLFRVEDDAVAATISSMDITDNIITLTLSASITAGSDVKLWVNYGKGDGWTLADLPLSASGRPIKTLYDYDVTEV